MTLNRFDNNLSLLVSLLQGYMLNIWEVLEQMSKNRLSMFLGFFCKVVYFQNCILYSLLNIYLLGTGVGFTSEK